MNSVRNGLIKEKSFYLLAASLALPMAAQDLIKFGLNLMDNIMVGSLSEVEISAVSMANQPFFIFSLLIFGLSSGGAMLASQYHGKGNMTAVRRVTGITMCFSIIAGIIISALVLLFPDFTLSIFTNEPAVIAAGAEYLRIVGWAYALYAVTTVCVMMLRGVKVTKPTLIINIIAFFINVILNWVFIFGNLGAPAMGIKGAAVATLTARVVEALLCAWYMRFRKGAGIGFRFSDMFHLDKLLVRDFFKYSMPVMANEFFWGLGNSGFAVILGRLGTDAMAAASITSCVTSFFSVLLFGISGATTVMVANAAGSGDTPRAKKISTTMLFVSVLIGIFVGALIFLLRRPVLSLYNISGATYDSTMIILAIAAVASCIESIGLTAIVGALRGAGDTRFAMWTDILPIWCLAIPLGLLCAFVWKTPFPIVYLALRCDVIIRALVSALRMRGTKWIRKLTREI